ncbi:MAG: hypothetical protein M3N53_13285 [Actinomycetota bacterium]|nr:hypothetical protein [Actinomycetota bacterium]
MWPRPRTIALIQASSYGYFSAWALTRREHYRRAHQLDAEDWILNAHAGWMALVCATLLTAAARDQVTNQERWIGLAAAAGLAANDAMLRGRIAPIYRIDLVYETALALLWLKAHPEERL